MKTKTNIVKDILMLAAFAGFAYLVSRNYKHKKLRERETHEFIHFQLF